MGLIVQKFGGSSVATTEKLQLVAEHIEKELETSYDRRRKKQRFNIYYAHPYRSGERGSNENGNRLIRRFIPKGTVITKISEEFIKSIENWINNLSRPTFGFKTSLEMSKQYC